MTTRLVLVGAGHTHLHLLVEARRLQQAGVEVVLVAPPTYLYSGGASAAAAGATRCGANAIDVAALAADREVVHHRGLVVGFDRDCRRVHLDDGSTVDHDLVSFNVGSVVGTRGIAVVGDDVVRVKPLEELRTLGDRLARLSEHGPARVAVVGAGATGLEVAGNVATRLGTPGAVTVFEGGPVIGPDLPDGARRRVVRRLRARGVVLRTGTPVSRVGDGAVVAGGQTHPFGLVVLATGLVANPVVSRLRLGDDRGIPVSATLQHVDDDHVHAAGDCAHFVPAPLPSLGVYGVRQGPVLLDGVLAHVQGRPRPAFTPQEQALRILDLGGGRGLAVRGRWWCEGRLARWVKLVIDRRWLRAHRV